LGGNRYLRGDFDAARRYAAMSLEQYREISQPQFLIGALQNLAMACIKLGEFSIAWNSLEESLTLSSSIGYENGVLGAVHAYANLLASNGEISRAISIYHSLLAHPGLWHQERIMIEEELAEWDLSSVMTRADLDFETVVQEILDGKW
jgi:tetratricopeptide (TPR) repeat protein